MVERFVVNVRWNYRLLHIVSSSLPIVDEVLIGKLQKNTTMCNKNNNLKQQSYFLFIKYTPTKIIVIPK